MKDDALIEEINDRFRVANTEWKDLRTEGDTDMRYVSGDPWDPKDRSARDNAKRPIISLDELSQYHNQVINNVRANPRAMKFTPQGNGANDESAEFYANKARETEYRSHAQLAYITAFENCVQRGFGWMRYVSKYAQENVKAPSLDAFYQELAIESIVNPNMVVPDPDAKRPDHADMDFLFYVEEFKENEFKRKWPSATITDFSPELLAMHKEWFRAGKVQVGEYWKKERTGKKTLLLLKPGGRSKDNPNPQPIPVWKHELEQMPSDEQIMSSRAVDTHKVVQYITNGVEILETNPWKGKYIPFVSCLGKVIYVDTGSGAKRQILSLTRLARDPAMLYCFIRTCEAEMVGMVTKFPYFAYEGQLSAEAMQDMAKSLHEPIAVVQVKPYGPGQAVNTGAPWPFPQRNLLAPDLQAYEVFAEAARRAIQAAMGVTPLPTNAQRKNDKSGVALKEVHDSEQIGSFHFGAHFDDMIHQGGVIFEDLVDKIYDTARKTAIRKADGTPAIVTINDPSVTDQKPISTQGDHGVTVSSGPAEDSQREVIDDFVGTLSQIPEIMAVAGDLIIKIRAHTMAIGLSPLMEELAERLTPPQFRKPKDGQQPDPKQLMQQLQQAGLENQQLRDAIAKLSMDIKGKVQERQEERQTEMMKLDKQAQLQVLLKRMDTAAKIEAARITAAKQPADTSAESQEEAVALALEHSFQASEAAKDRTHELLQAQMEHQQELEQADQEHQQALEQGQQAHAQALQQGEQAHGQALEQGAQGIAGDLTVQANAPQPTNGSGA